MSERADGVTGRAGNLVAGTTLEGAVAGEKRQPSGPEPSRFRQVLGQFCTGVTVVTSMDGGEPVGFACQAFVALSLDPPLVLFCPSRKSGSWKAIERAGRFCVNVLGESQREVSRAFGTQGADKFASVGWSASEQGSPVLEGVLSWIDCAIETVHTAGDHYVVIGRVVDLGNSADDRPLLFYRGDYTATDYTATDDTATDDTATDDTATDDTATDRATDAGGDDGTEYTGTEYTGTELVASAGPADPGLPGALLEAVMSWPRHHDWM